MHLPELKRKLISLAEAAACLAAASAGAQEAAISAIASQPGNARDGHSVTPEVSGIYSTTSADGNVSLSASYQSRTWA
jgi:hypothetical protein